MTGALLLGHIFVSVDSKPQRIIVLKNKAAWNVDHSDLHLVLGQMGNAGVVFLYHNVLKMYAKISQHLNTGHSDLHLFRCKVLVPMN